LSYHKAREQGVAVIMVMLVLAIVAVTTAALVKRHQFNQAMATQVIHLGQAKAHIQGAELWAYQLLKQDKQDNNVDHMAEAWAQITPPLPVAQGFLHGQIEDLQGKFNLNSLVAENNIHQPSMALFERLLKQHNLDPQLAWHLVDWIDPNVETHQQGTLEDAYYLALPVPYRSANQALLDVSELGLVRGFNAATVAILKPYVAALPYGSEININSANEGLLMAMSSAINRSKAQQLITRRKLNYWSNSRDFVDAAVGPKSSSNQNQWTSLMQISTVSSHFFSLNVNALFGEINTRLESTLQRSDNGTVTTLTRIYTP
jgi:general secretion pathway protein K|tara:strand:+ start:7744 stop:8694 length:951 start_codon:yes stop_codon:yes gene_type:complete